MIVHTESGSSYEIDEGHSRARRVTGYADPTEMCADGWRRYDACEFVAGRLCLVWTDVPGKDFGQRGTLTSRVVWVERNDGSVLSFAGDRP